MYLGFCFIILFVNAFELIDCSEKNDLFSNPSYTSSQLKLTYVQPFGILQYTKTSCSWKPLLFGFSTFGDKLYRENEILLGYGRREKGFSWGISIKAMGVQIENYGQAYTLGLNGGISAYLQRTIFALSINNFNGPCIGMEKIPRRIFGEISTSPTEEFSLSFGIYKEENHPIEIRGTSEIILNKWFEIVFGIKTSPACYTAGFISHIKKLDFSYLARTHLTLGVTHIFAMGYFFERSE